MPFVRPVTVHDVVAVEQVNEPGDDVTVYEEIAAPPVDDGAVQETTDWAFAFDVADTLVGAPGTVEGVAEADAIEAEPVPDAFAAVTVNVYAVPFVRPVIVHGFTRTQETGV